MARGGGDGREGLIRAPREDVLQPFQLEASRLRGRLVRLGPAVDTVLTRHAYPEPVSRLMGELLVLAASLAGALKFGGVFSLQTRSDGPVSLMVADCTNDGALRGYARFDPARLGDGPADMRALLGDGLLALTVDQAPGAETYQGIVALAGGTLAECMNVYFRQSEQIATGLRLAVGRAAPGGHWRAGAIVVQRLPEDGDLDLDREAGDEDWRRAMLLLGTVRDEELADPDQTVESVLFRLFHEEGVRLFQPSRLRFGCRCARAKVSRMLARFPPEELDGMKREDGRIAVTCQFCNRTYLYDDADLAALPAPRARH